jgi:hypothetical protein
VNVAGMTKGRSRSKVSNNTKTVHWAIGDEPLCGRSPVSGLEATDAEVTCRWCLAAAAKPGPKVGKHHSKRVCAECGEDWPCRESRQPVGAIRSWYLAEIGRMMTELGHAE